MRFKAKLHNWDLLMRIVSTVEKTEKKCIMQLGPDSILFILLSDIQEGVQIWSNVKVRAIFTPGEYKIESLRQNEIAFEVVLENLKLALRSSQFSNEVIVKLTKKDKLPYLSFHIKSIQSRQEVLICHDVPITLISNQRMAEIVEPTLPDPRVHLALPPLKLIRPVIESVKNMGDVLIFRADLGGNLTLSVETEAVSISTYYRNLEIPSIEGKAPTVMDSSISCEVKIHIRKFRKFLATSQVEPKNVICCLVENHALVLHVLLEDMFMTYYIPCIENI